jgi:hypothetical protein
VLRSAAMANRSTPAVHLPLLGFGSTLRRDAWWVGPAITVLVLTGFVVYATFRAFENSFYEWGPYLSPMYSPFVSTKGWPIPVSPAMVILPLPGSFRLTCYYYRKAYYRSFAMDPPACGVGERQAPSHKYNGETKLLLFQNLHRFALYGALVVLVFLWGDFVRALSWSDGFHAGVGTLVLFTNAFLLTGYTFGCHSFRHLIGGSVNSYSNAPLGKLRFGLWKLVSKLNGRHMAWAWTSLFGVVLTDVYVRMVATGAINDVRIF